VEVKVMMWFGVQDVSMLTGLSNSTIRRAVETGQLHGLTTPGGHNRFSVSDVHNFCRSLGLV